MRSVLVFDFGGGTFDLSLLVTSNGGISMANTNVDKLHGDMRLGGLDLDQVLVRMCENKI